MRSVSLRTLFALFVLILAPALFAHDVTITGTQNFASLDGSSSDHDGTANGVFTVGDGNLIVNGVVNCNDDGASTSACPMAFSVSGNMTVNAGGALYAENRSGGGTGGAITMTVGGNLALNGNAIISSASGTSSGSTGGAITANVTGTVSIASGSTIDSGATNATGGNIAISSGGAISVDGNVLSGPSRTILATRLTGVALSGGTANQVGGAITISSTTFAEPALLVGTNANIISQGENGGAGPVTLDACGIQVRGLVAALSRKDSAAKVVIRSGKDVLVDGRDLGATGTRMGRLRADAPSGTALNKGVDIFAKETIDLFGPGGSMYLITSLPGLHDSKSYGGLIRITSLEETVNGSGNLIDNGHTASGDTGGATEIAAKGDVTLNTAVIHAVGDFSTNNSNRGGGSIAVRSYSGNVIWTNGSGDVRPVGSTSGLPLADQGTITLTACGTVNTTGTSFPTNGVPTGMFPVVTTGVCSPAAPSLPSGSSPLVTCNTPPVANDTSATTNEDTTVTITLSGTDADGDSLTFSIVSGPSNGVLGPVISTGPTTATVDYTPNPNYNGSDSFVFEANDGNGGTDQATAAITINPVNDPPTFLVGPTVTALEDSGASSYPNWVTAISPGPTADESGQTVTFSTSNDNNALFSVQPSVAPDGTLSFTPAANACGSATITVTAQDNGGIANGGDDTSNPQTSTITITCVNDEPSFVKGADQTVNEDAGPQTVTGWATAISAGPNEGSQTVSFVTSNDNNALFSAQPSVASDGTLTYTPAANANGSATVTIYAQDDGGIANGGDDTSPSQTFTITVNAVNDAPSFTSGGNVTVNEDSGAYSAAWATAISAGPADESGQTVSFNTSNDNNALFSVQPSIDSSGNLTFTLAANAYGSANVTVTLSDNGGIANGGDDTSDPQTFVITVNAVNDEPSFTSGGNVTVNEDSGAYSAAWATGISAGPNESGQTLTFVTSNDNNALFSAQPSVSPSGVLTFTPAANANGTATVTIYLMDDGGTAFGGDDTSPSQTFVITVNAVNDEPSFTSGGDVSVNEDSGAYSAAWATAISAGPADESGQTFTFFVSNDNNALFSAQPAIDASGNLTFTPAANAFGSATVSVYLQDNGGIANGGDDTSPAQTFTISVGAVNDEPSFTAGGDVTVNEDSGSYSAVWATGISAGPNEGGQTVTFNVSNDNNALFASQPSISPTGVLTFTPAANAFGSATVSVYLMDNGGIANGGDDTSPTVTFVITVNAVNDEPSFVSGGNVTVLEDSGAYSAGWATGISAGPANESGQNVTFFVSNDNNALFASQPSISSTGVLTFTPALNAFGSATVSVYLMDDGGIANGGDDTSPTQTFTITVTPVNDAPSFTPGGDVTVNEDSGPYAASWATAISPGPNESGQTVSFNVSNNNNALFLVQPSISPAGVLTFTTNLNANGSAIVSVSLSDNGGIANGGVDTSATVQFTINVTAVNDAPTAAADAWDTLGNTELRVDFAGGLTPKISDTTTSGNGVADNDSDPENDPFVITGIVGCSDVTAPFDCTLGDGSKVSMLANGSFSYTPGPGNTTGSFQYTLTDIPTLGSPQSSTGTVTITIYDMIWYVNGAAAPGGNGTSIAPYTNLTSLDGVGGVGDVDGPGATIFVHTSAVTGNIPMEASQKLHGEGVGLSTTQNLNGNGSPQVLVAPGVKPAVTSGTNTVLVNSVAGVDIAGLSLASTGGNAIEVTNPPAGPVTSASIHDNVVTAATAEGIDVNGGSAAGTTVTINNTPITSAGNGLDVTANGSATISYTNGTILSTGGDGIHMAGGGNLTVTGLSNVTIDGNTAGDGIDITSATFDAIAGGAFNTVNAGVIAIGTSGNPVGLAGLSLSNVSGVLSFGTLTSFAGTGAAVSVAGSGLFTGATGMQVSGGGSGSVASAPSNTAVSISNASIGASHLTFDRVTSSGAVNGIVLNTTGTSGGLHVTGTGPAGSGGSISSPTGAGVLASNTAHLQLAEFSITNPGASGIAATNLGGVCALTNTTVTQFNAATANGFSVVNNNTNLTSLTILGSTFSNAPTGNDGLFIEAQGTSSMTVTVDQNSHFTGLFGDGVQANTTTGASGTVTVNVRNSLFDNSAPLGNGGISLNPFGGPVTFTFDIDTNVFDTIMRPITNLGAINVTSGDLDGGGPTVNGTIQSNVMNNLIGSRGISVTGDTFAGPLDLLIDDNEIDRLGSTSKHGISVNTVNNATADVTITNNRIGQKANLWTAGNGTGNAILVTTQTVSSINTLIDSNVVTANATLEVIRVRAINTSSLQATVTNNTVTDSAGAHIELNANTATAVGVGPTLCYNVSGNIVPAAGVGVIQLNENAGALNVVQASAAAVSAANNNATVTQVGTPQFGTPACPIP